MIKSAFFLTIANLCVSAIPFLLLPFYTYNLSPSELGIYSLVITTSSLLTLFIGLGTNGSIYVKYSRPLELNLKISYKNNCIFLISLFFLLALLIYLTADHFTSINFISENNAIAALIIAYFQCLISFSQSIFQIESKINNSIVATSGPIFLSNFLSITFIYFLNLGLDGRIYAQIFGTSIIALICVSYLSISKDFFSYLNFRTSIELIKTGTPLVIHLIGGLLVNATEVFVINKLLGSNYAGIYTVAFQLSLPINILCASVNSIYSPWLFKKLNDPNLDIHTQNKIVFNTYLYFSAIIITTFLYALIVQYFGPDLINEKFNESFRVFNILVVGQALAGMYFIFSNYLLWSGKTIYLAASTLTVGIVHIIITYIFISQFESIGIGLGFICSQTLILSSTWLIASKIVFMPWRRFFYDF